MGTIFLKELKHFIFSPIAYIVGGTFHGILGFFFYNSLMGYATRVGQLSGSTPPPPGFTPTLAILQGLFNSMGTVFLLLTPLITMRLVSEERRGRTMEMLLTSPLPLSAIVLGKFLAALTVYTVIAAMTIYMPLTIEVFSTVNWLQVSIAYLGVFLMGGAMISVGLLTSAVTERQVVAAVLCIGILVIFWFVGGGIGAADHRVTEFMRDMSLYTPFANLISGLLDSRDVMFLVSFSLSNLFISHRVLSAGRR